jgi:hypothetical protein
MTRKGNYDYSCRTFLFTIEQNNCEIDHNQIKSSQTTVFHFHDISSKFWNVLTIVIPKFRESNNNNQN